MPTTSSGLSANPSLIARLRRTVSTVAATATDKKETKIPHPILDLVLKRTGFRIARDAKGMMNLSYKTIQRTTETMANMPTEPAGISKDQPKYLSIEPVVVFCKSCNWSAPNAKEQDLAAPDPRATTMKEVNSVKSWNVVAEVQTSSFSLHGGGLNCGITVVDQNIAIPYNIWVS
nr:hypothetical protein GOBAR_AA29713 [Ipomoea batatas]